MLKKIVTSLTLEIDELKLHANEIKNKNESLNEKVLDLTSCLVKFTQGEFKFTTWVATICL